MKHSLPVLTNSQMRTFRRCARLHYLMYVLLYRVVEEADALRFGDLMHVGLEAWWKATMNRLDAAVEAMRPRAKDDYELARAVVLMQGYDTRWLSEAADFEVISVEHVFRAPLVNPETGAASRTYELGGKLDVIVRDRCTGLVRLIEHKTTSEELGAGSDYWKRLIIDPQISTYFAGGKATGYDIADCLYDVIGKPGLRPASVPLTDEQGVKIVHDASGTRVRTKDGKKWRETADTAQGYVLQTRPETAEEFQARLALHVAEQPERYYQRGNVVRLEAEEADAAYDAWATARNIADATNSGRWPRNPDACVAYGTTCGFFGVCTGTASLEDESRFRRASTPHEELAAEAA